MPSLSPTTWRVAQPISQALAVISRRFPEIRRETKRLASSSMEPRLLAVLLVVGLCSCAGVRPPLPAESRIEAPSAWRDGETTTVVPVDPRWWHQFGDDTLDSLVERAVLDNDDERIAIARLSEARADARLARSTTLPHMELQSVVKRDAGISPFGLADQETAADFGVSIAYDTDIFGRLRNIAGAASARVAEAAATRDAVHLAVASATAAAYIGLRALDARLEVVQSTLALRAESLRVEEHRSATGYSSALELRQAESEYLATKQLIPQLQTAITAQENALAMLLGRTPGPIPRGTPFAALQTPALPHTLPSTVIRQRPDIYAAEQRLIATDRTLSAARAAFLPNIALEAGVGRAFSTLFPEPITLWTVGGSILAPIFEGGALRAGQDRAVAQREQAAFAYRATVLTALREVEDQMTAARDTRERMQLLSAQTDALAAAYRLAVHRYRAGYSSYLEQLDAQRGLLNAQLSLVRVRANHLLAFVGLYRAVGGGWHIPESTDLHASVDPSK
jgi:outer membrane protein, multidrug efflux system